MIMKKTFSLGLWSAWDDAIAGAAELFRNLFSVYPNVLLANDVTLRRIDMIAEKAQLKNENGEKAKSGMYCRVGGFVTEGFELTFGVDKTLSDGNFSLIYDSDPDDDGEPIPEEDTDAVEIKKTGTA